MVFGFGAWVELKDHRSGSPFGIPQSIARIYLALYTSPSPGTTRKHDIIKLQQATNPGAFVVKACSVGLLHPPLAKRKGGPPPKKGGIAVGTSGHVRQPHPLTCPEILVSGVESRFAGTEAGHMGILAQLAQIPSHVLWLWLKKVVPMFWRLDETKNETCVSYLILSHTHMVSLLE